MNSIELSSCERKKINMNGKMLHQAPCSISHFTLDLSTGEVSVLLGKDAKDHSRDIVHLSLMVCYKICYSAVCSGFPRDMITSDFSHDRSVLISVPLSDGKRYCIKITVL